MNFNTLVKKELGPVLEKHGFHLSEEIQNGLTYDSRTVLFIFGVNPLDRMPTITLRYQGAKTPAILGDEAIAKVLHSDLKVDHTLTHEVVQNLRTLFEEQAGSRLLDGDLEELYRFTDERTLIYNAERHKQQWLSVADRAWTDKDYRTFVAAIDELDKDALSQSYHLKYDYAKTHL